MADDPRAPRRAAAAPRLTPAGFSSERYFAEDPNTCLLLKLRQLTEMLAQLTATRIGLYAGSEKGVAYTGINIEDLRTPALLAKAFRGELVQQDPNDEPASAMLARVRQSAPAVPIGRRRRAPAAVATN
jgi:hypothetical protein